MKGLWSAFFTRRLHALAAIALAACLTGPACKKNLIDYRNKYTGTFHMVITTSCWTANNGPAPAQTREYIGSVRYRAGIGGNKSLVIEYSEDNELELLFARDGALKFICGEPGDEDATDIVVGRFSDADNFEFVLGNCLCSSPCGLGGGCENRITGSRSE
jgi:hypothetical protein